MAETRIDPVLVSIIARGLKAITDEMSLSMEKTTRSPILCEARDFVTGLYDAEGRMLEQTENLPILSFSLSPVCQHIARTFAGRIYPGDVFFHNDVFSLWQPEQRRGGVQADLLDGDRAGGLVRNQGSPGGYRGRGAWRIQPERHRGLAGSPSHSRPSRWYERGQVRKPTSGT